MPCRMDDYPPTSYVVREIDTAEVRKLKADLERIKKAADKLTHDNDMLREAVLKAANSDPKLYTKTFLKKVGVDQIKHRKEDLARLEKTFRDSKDAERLGKVMLADPNHPLEPQLGFDPDKF